MDVGTAKKLLQDNGIAIKGEKRLGNESGTQLRIMGLWSMCLITATGMFRGEIPN